MLVFRHSPAWIRPVRTTSSCTSGRASRSSSTWQQPTRTGHDPNRSGNLVIGTTPGNLNAKTRCPRQSACPPRRPHAERKRKHHRDLHQRPKPHGRAAGQRDYPRGRDHGGAEVTVGGEGTARRSERSRATRKLRYWRRQHPAAATQSLNANVSGSGTIISERHDPRTYHYGQRIRNVTPGQPVGPQPNHPRLARSTRRRAADPSSHHADATVRRHETCVAEPRRGSRARQDDAGFVKVSEHEP